MQKRKINEVVKIAAASLLSIALFGGVLLGANRLAFANAASRTMELPPLEAMNVSPEINNAVSLGAALSASPEAPRSLNVKETASESWIFGSYHQRDENTLTAGEAAQLGARYIYELFGECIDGATVHMTFNGHMRHRGGSGVWSGIVGDGILPGRVDTDIPMLIGIPSFLFMINAETGEAIHVERMTQGEDGMIILTPRSDARITMEVPHFHWGEPGDRFDRWNDGEIHVGRRFSVKIFPREGLPEGWELPGDWETIMDTLYDVFKSGEWRDKAGNPFIIHQFVPDTPNASQQNGNGYRA
jgi:hypothetical protein